MRSKNHPTLTGQDTRDLTTHPANYWQKAAHSGKTAQVTGMADKAWPMAHAGLVLHVARLMGAAVGGGINPA